MITNSQLRANKEDRSFIFTILFILCARICVISCEKNGKEALKVEEDGKATEREVLYHESLYKYAPLLAQVLLRAENVM